MNQEVEFKHSRIIPTTFLLILTGFLMSFIPEVNWGLLGFNLGLAAVCMILFIVLWRVHRYQSKRYFSLLSYVMLNVLTIHFTIPVFRIIYGTAAFWAGIVILAALVLLPYLFSEKIAQGIQNPGQTGLGKIYKIYAPLIIVFGTVLFAGTIGSSNPDALAISIFLFLCGMIFLSVAPVMLITPQRMEELENQ
ncbi:hypothetical protein GCM10008986_25280 [Salinibacillus aidingensis]|uniref:Uncharacterized protein n=1 Tax=Salinibacillus aidingensis TaxID=237684 RepID=A0ABN1BGM7_9BACI